MKQGNQEPACLPTPGSARSTRQRKWHPRVFTGCLNCRKRHVKCDEQTPSCGNCTRLDKPCTFSLKFVPVSVDRQSLTKSNATTLASTKTKAVAPAIVTTASSDDMIKSNKRNPQPRGQLLQRPENRMIQVAHITEPRSFARLGVPAQVPWSESAMYYQHFLQTVSSLLIIFDTPSNSNPYRLLLNLVGNENASLLQTTMEALGAMHLARLPEAQNRTRHQSAAIKMYASIVSQLRHAFTIRKTQAASLELLAICLLLCMFEKMSSSDASWKVHLMGAGQIVQSMYSPSPALATQEEATPITLGGKNLPIRRFLVSLMSYLDVAASCATGEAPLIAGDYWETLGGGWQYNLGVPDFSATHCSENRILPELRGAWSEIMSIQAEIGNFAQLQRSGQGKQHSDSMHSRLVGRLKAWHNRSPDIFLPLKDVDSIPDSATNDQVETLTVVACVQSYALACAVYLERVATRRIQLAASDDKMKPIVDRTLTLTLNFSCGANQLAILWPLLTAALATADPVQQALCRNKLIDMQRFGFKVRLPNPFLRVLSLLTSMKHVSRALDTMEYCWQQMSLYNNVDYEKFEAMLSLNLVP
ncbi:hypothetical protein K4F52_006838 [Lecanicillium sp. MT-2017a]|nr:hypothetical protein K4F52_006838 [Lecanicillium sp. MT-2017a]